MSSSDFSDSVLYKLILLHADIYSTLYKSSWPNHLQLETIKARANEKYSFWGGLGTIIANGNRQPSRVETRYISVPKSEYRASIYGGSMVFWTELKQENRLVPDHGAQPFPIRKTDYRAYLESTYSQIQQRAENLKRLDKSRERWCGLSRRCENLIFYLFNNPIVYMIRGIKKIIWKYM